MKKLFHNLKIFFHSFRRIPILLILFRTCVILNFLLWSPPFPLRHIKLPCFFWHILILILSRNIHLRFLWWILFISVRFLLLLLLRTLSFLKSFIPHFFYNFLCQLLIFIINTDINYFTITNFYFLHWTDWINRIILDFWIVTHKNRNQMLK